MDNRSTTRREAPARVPTAEERADEDRRHEEARRPAPDLRSPLRVAVDNVIDHGDPIQDRILNKGWIPTTTAEVAAVLEEHASSLDSAHDEMARQAARLALLEQRLDPDADYQQSGGEGDDLTALDGLWEESHNADGTRRGPDGDDEAEALPDLRHRRLRPTTWAQLCDVLVVLAEEASGSYKFFDQQATDTKHLQALVSNLTDAVVNPGSRRARDIVEAFVLETLTRLEATHHRAAAHDVGIMWHLIDLYSQERFDKAELVAWKLVMK